MTNVDSVQDSVSIEQLVESDITTMLEINEQGLPGTGKVNHQEMENLLKLSELSLGVFKHNKLTRICYLFATKNCIWQPKLCLVQ